MTGTDRIVKREVLYIQVKLTSPLSVSSGENEWSDSDVLRDAEGNPYVSGSSIAGAMRAYLNFEKNEDCFMGFSGQGYGTADGRMSSLFISDMTFDGTHSADIRDFVSLDENKTAKAGSKFDMEIIEAGARAHFYMELTVRENDDADEMHRNIGRFFCGVTSGEIRLGSKKTRGFGEFEILAVKSRTYDNSNFPEYANAYEDTAWVSIPDSLKDWMSHADDCAGMVHIEVPLRMRGGISIRRYAAKKGEPDFVHITGNGVPVIPGSSMAGALRSRVENILHELEMAGVQIPEKSGIVNTMFGYVDKNEACASNVIISETEIEDAKPLVMVRTGVSRFESAVKQGALYKEKTFVDGTLKLEILVRGDSWVTGLLMLAIKDLQNGLLAVGGQTSIGRGIFEAAGPVSIDGKTGIKDMPWDEMSEAQKKESFAAALKENSDWIEENYIRNFVSNMASMTLYGKSGSGMIQKEGIVS